MRHLALGLLVLSIAGGAWLWRDAGTPRPAAPSVAYTLLDGARADSTQWRGKVVLVKFWATTCAVCLQTMPQTVEHHQRYHPRGFDTVAVAMQYDPPALVARYAEQRQLPFGVAIDNTGAIARAFGDVQATPTTFLIDRQGRIVKRFVGEPDEHALRTLIEDLLAQA